jgi:hypothetical protein
MIHVAFVCIIRKEGERDEENLKGNDDNNDSNDTDR